MCGGSPLFSHDKRGGISGSNRGQGTASCRVMLSRAVLVAFLGAMLGITRQRHSLPLLLCLERAVVICFVVLVGRAELVFASILLRIGAVEGAVGLGCLVGLVRARGRELASTHVV